MRMLFLTAVAVILGLASHAQAAGPAKAPPGPGTPVWVSIMAAGDEGASGQGRCVAVDPEGNLLVAGFLEGRDGNYDLSLYKHSPQGDLLWSRRYDYSWYEIGTAVVSDAGRNVIVAGAGNDPDNPRDAYLKTYYTDYVLLKYSPDGALMFEVTASGNDRDNEPVAICAGPDGEIYVTGLAKDAAGTHNAYYTVRFSASGELEWEKFEDWGTESVAAGIALSPDGVVVTGYVWDFEQQNYDIKTVKYSRYTGATLAASTYKAKNEYYDETASGLAADRSGALYITGRTSESDGVALTLKLDADLGPVWAAPLQIFDRESEGLAVGVDEYGRVYVAGRLGPGPGGLILLVYGPDGALLDAREVGLDFEFTVESMAVEPDGDLVLTGAATEDGEPDRTATIRLAGYPAKGPSYFNLQDAIVGGKPLSLAEPPARMLRTVLLEIKKATLYGCLPVTVVIARPVGVSEEYEYSFFVTRGDGLTWEKARDYSPINFWAVFPRTDTEPVTGVMVQVRPAGSSMAYEAKEWVYLDAP